MRIVINSLLSTFTKIICSFDIICHRYKAQIPGAEEHQDAIIQFLFFEKIVVLS